MGKGEFAYYKLEFSDFETIRESMTPEQGMDLLAAIIEYTKSGTVVDVPQEAKVFFAMLRKKQDRAKAKYDELCNKLAENGKKGGEAKAKNAKGEAKEAEQVKKFKPPTLTQFKNAVKRIVEDNGFDSAEDYDIESFYDQLKEANWQFEGMAIQSRKDWEKIIFAKFHDAPYRGQVPISMFTIYQYILAKYPQLHNRWDDVDSLEEEFHESWTDRERTLIIDGQAFHEAEWKKALDVLAAKYTEELPP